ncbi:zinc-binding dehydrogenase [Streptomyces sp. TS71-3]|uniref:quinone oxidoreductase family protein n=1 Tax=Streptomyces sp. TS71-3 TaxID=2733862 RepID=UPI001B231BA5|nr:zinc-binding dehydrogenase [Streptomyces sp. TS71-3]GHJ34431.1 oxidoreductase [Streptomyces sp. TS71-3]
MRRVRYHEYGGPEVLTVEEAEVPVPGPGQVLLRTEAVGANYVDALIRRGHPEGSPYHRPLPGSFTGDVLGTVESVGEGVGEEVAALAGRRAVALVAENAFADHVVADADWLTPVPEDLEAGAASALCLVAPVALGTLRAGRMEPGATVLVHAAAGGIGHLAVQLARLLGAGTVIGTVGARDKLDFVRGLGADAAISYLDEDWPGQVRKVAPGGVDVVLDGVGEDTTLQSLDLLAPFGRTVVYGSAKGRLTDLPVRALLALKGVVGFSLLAYRKVLPEQAAKDVELTRDHLATGRLSVEVHARIPLAEAAEIHRIFEARTHRGRVLLVP